VNGDKSKPAAPIIPGTGTNPDEPLDMKLLSDVPAWLRSLRLHKYTPNFEHSNWKEMVGMNDAALDAKGVNALGARRKLLKVFENVRNQQGIPVSLRRSHLRAIITDIVRSTHLEAKFLTATRPILQRMTLKQYTFSSISVQIIETVDPLPPHTLEVLRPIYDAKSPFLSCLTHVRNILLSH
jgi:hypothetical protein